MDSLTIGSSFLKALDLLIESIGSLYLSICGSSQTGQSWSLEQAKDCLLFGEDVDLLTISLMIVV